MHQLRDHSADFFVLDISGKWFFNDVYFLTIKYKMLSGENILGECF